MSINESPLFSGPGGCVRLGGRRRAMGSENEDESHSVDFSSLPTFASPL